MPPSLDELLVGFLPIRCYRIGVFGTADAGNIWEVAISPRPASAGGLGAGGKHRIEPKLLRRVLLRGAARASSARFFLDTLVVHRYGLGTFAWDVHASVDLWSLSHGGSIALSSRGDAAAVSAAGVDGLCMWRLDAARGRPEKIWSETVAPNRQNWWHALSPDGKALAVVFWQADPANVMGLGRWSLELRSGTTGEIACTVTLPDMPLRDAPRTSMSMGFDGATAVICFGAGGTDVAFDAAARTCGIVSKAPCDATPPLGGLRLRVRGSTATIRHSDRRDEVYEADLVGVARGAFLRRAEFAPDGRKVLLTFKDFGPPPEHADLFSAHLWDFNSGRKPLQILADADEPPHTRFSADSALAACAADGALSLVDLAPPGSDEIVRVPFGVGHSTMAVSGARPP